MSAYIAVLYTTQGPVFAPVATINEGQAFLGQWISQQPLRIGEAMAIITADTERVIYYRNLSKVQDLIDAFCQPWVSCKQWILGFWVATKAA